MIIKATEDLGCALKALVRDEREYCKADEMQLFQALSVLMKDYPERLVIIYEAFKCRSTSRMRRGWSNINCKGAVVREQFQNSTRFSLITIDGINSFAPEPCHTVLRDQIDDESAIGTVDADCFCTGLRHLRPVLEFFPVWRSSIRSFNGQHFNARVRRNQRSNQ